MFLQQIQRCRDISSVLLARANFAVTPSLPAEYGRTILYWSKVDLILTCVSRTVQSTEQRVDFHGSAVPIEKLQSASVDFHTQRASLVPSSGRSRIRKLPECLRLNVSCLKRRTFWRWLLIVKSTWFNPTRSTLSFVKRPCGSAVIRSEGLSRCLSDLSAVFPVISP